MRSVGEQTVAEVGEDAVLRAILEVAGPQGGRDRRLSVGPGEDDAAVLLPPPGTRQVLTVDTMAQDQDFRLGWWTDPEAAARSIGTKAAAQNLSDLNAMGAVPELLLVSLTLPPATTVRWVRDFYHGLLDACARPGAERCVVGGGDLGSGERTSVTITAVGRLAEGSAGLLRSGARPGDILAASGGLGCAAAGLALLERFGTAEQALLQIRDGQQEAVTVAAGCLQAQMRPEPPLTAGPAALRAGATAGMDLSDGLLRDAGRLAEASGVSLALDDEVLAAEAEVLLPLAGVLGETAESTASWVYAGGEEYALLAAFPPGDLPAGFRRIGEVRERRPGDPAVLSRHSGGRTGWSSF